MMLSWTDLKPGKKIIYEWIPHEVISHEHLKVAMWKWLEKVSLKNLITWNNLSNLTFREVDKFEEAEVNSSSCEYLYRAWEDFFFMDTQTFEQVSLNEETIWDAKFFLVEWDKVILQEFNWNPINVKLEPNVTLEITDTPPGERWNTATWGKKPATLNTGLVVQVPLFLNIGDKVIVDTRTHEYRSRA
jgi:elongation factor P